MLVTTDLSLLYRFACIVSALPLQQSRLATPSASIDLKAQCDAHSTTGADLPLYTTERLMKRSPVGNESVSSSRGRPVNMMDLHEYQIGQKKQIVMPEEYLKLIDKAEESGSNGVMAYNGDEPWLLRGNAIKWLERGEASVLRSPEILADTRSYYDAKKEEMSRPEDIIRAEMKGHAWNLLQHFPQYEEVLALIGHPEVTYEKDMKRFETMMAKEISKGASEEVVAATNKKLQEAADAFASWTSTTDPEKAMIMVNKELNKFSKVSNRRRWLEYNNSKYGASSIKSEKKIERMKKEMVDHATKAIAWNIKVIELQLKEDEKAEKAEEEATDAMPLQ